MITNFSVSENVVSPATALKICGRRAVISGTKADLAGQARWSGTNAPLPGRSSWT